MLDELADRFRVPTEELVRASVEEVLAEPPSEFRLAVERVLEKNTELYERLA